MTQAQNQQEIYFLNLILMYATSAWCQLGKTPSPVDGKIKKDLASAKITIDMLCMIREKTKGNLNKKEEDMLNSTVADLQLNYSEEIAKPNLQSPQNNESK
jgi:hypothetical protein